MSEGGSLTWPHEKTGAHTITLLVTNSALGGRTGPQEGAGAWGRLGKEARVPAPPPATPSRPHASEHLVSRGFRQTLVRLLGWGFALSWLWGLPNRRSWRKQERKASLFFVCNLGSSVLGPGAGPTTSFLPGSLGCMALPSTPPAPTRLPNLSPLPSSAPPPLTRRPV